MGNRKALILTDIYVDICSESVYIAIIGNERSIMKITSAHFDQLENMIKRQIETTGYKLSEYFALYKPSYNTKGGDWKKRFRWDLVYSIPYTQRATWFTEVYKYANDAHIDTALRKITKEYL